MKTETNSMNSKIEESSKVFKYEREPVPEYKTKGARSFWGLFTSEHVAGTELLIGPLFVVHGVAALYGLILMPMGAVIFADQYLMKWLGIKSFYATSKKIGFYLPPALA